MSRDMNKVLLLGRLGMDPVLRFTKVGTPVAHFNLATESYSKAKNEALTTWHRIVIWGKPAERVNQELKKGMPVFLEGGIRLRKYEDQEGEVHYVHEIHVEQVTFLHRKERPIPVEGAAEETTDEALSVEPKAMEASAS